VPAGLAVRPDPAQVLAERELDPSELKRPSVGAMDIESLLEEGVGLIGRGRQRG
jgi:hypothetical protein